MIFVLQLVWVSGFGWLFRKLLVGFFLGVVCLV